MGVGFRIWGLGFRDHVFRDWCVQKAGGEGLIPTMLTLRSCFVLISTISGMHSADLCNSGGPPAHV